MSSSLSVELAEGFAWIESFTNFEKRPGSSLRPFRLDRMRSLAESCGNPQNDYRIVHIAGSKGKGSTSVFLGSILHEAGFTVGIYTSPHVDSYRERFLLNRGFISQNTLLKAITTIKTTFKESWFTDRSEPTTFELLTLTALLSFKYAGCDWVVLETGLGGRLDATNIVTPLLSVITSIELEHTRILGNTLEEVAAEKGGIIKTNVPVLLGNIPESAMETLKNIAAERNAPVSEINLTLDTEISVSRVSFSLSDGSRINAVPGMKGRHQGINALTAAKAAEIILSPAVPKLMASIIQESIIQGVSKAGLPGRFEIVRSGERDIIFDAAHTPSSIQAASETFRDLYPETGVLIIGLAEDKDAAAIAKVLPQGLSAIIVARPGSFRVSDPKKTAAALSVYFPEVELVPDSGDALRRAKNLAAADEPILITGSFYLLGDIRSKGDFS